MRTSDEKDLRLGHHSLNESMALPRLASEFLGRVDRWIDLPAECLHGRSQCLEDNGKGCIAYDHDIDVAAGTLLASGDGPVDEGGLHHVPKGGEQSAQELRRAGGLGKQAFQLREYGRFSVGPEAHRDIARIAQDESQIDQAAQLPMRGSGARCRLTGDLAQMKPLVLVLEQKGEQRRTTAAEQCTG
jgi:hypothetical protein